MALDDISPESPTESSVLPDASTTSASSAKPVRGVRRWLQEPMLHFVLLGAGLFLVYHFMGDESGVPDDAQIVVSEGKIEHLATLFRRTWQRSPTREELEALIDDFVREEVAYREGTTIGLDRDDTIIRRRIRQKLDFVADDFASQLEATDEELEAYLAAHPEDFRVPARLSFQQVYFDPGRHGDDLPELVGDLITTLRDDPAVKASEQGDRTLLGFRFVDVSEREVGNTFGAQFATRLLELEPGSWQGPIESSFGLHAVLVEDLRQGEVPSLESARDAVRREWEHQRRLELTEEFYRGLLDRYEVVIRWPEAEEKS